MGTRLIASVPFEGGVWEYPPNPEHPIRLYTDRRIQDDIFRKHGGKKTRARLNRMHYRWMIKALKYAASDSRV